MSNPYPQQEQTYLQEGHISVSNLRVIVYGKTYAMNQIASVAMRATQPSNSAGIAIVLAGAAGLIASASKLDQSLTAVAMWAVPSILLIAGGMWLASKNQYICLIQSSSGAVSVIQSPDKEKVSKIVEAINQAIITRG